jgi:hypothetical protein
MSNVSAASGPYAAELSASNPKMAIPDVGPSFSPPSSDERRGLPNNRFVNDIAYPLSLKLPSTLPKKRVCHRILQERLISQAASAI